MPDWQEGEVNHHGVRLAYHRTGGDKPALVLAHGATDSGLCWSRTARYLEDRFDVVMVDARGHGTSERANASFDPADDLAFVIDALGLEAPRVMGHSMGANAAAALAARYPDRVSRMILEDPPWMPDAAAGPKSDAPARDQFKEWLAAAKEMSLDEVIESGKRFSVGWAEEEFPAWAKAKHQFQPGIFGHVRYEKWQDLVPRIQSPTLVIYGDVERGGLFGGEVVARVTSGNNCIRTHHIAGAGHNIRREQFDAFIAAVTDFLTDG